MGRLCKISVDVICDYCNKPRTISLQQQRKIESGQANNMCRECCGRLVPKLRKSRPPRKKDLMGFEDVYPPVGPAGFRDFQVVCPVCNKPRSVKEKTLYNYIIGVTKNRCQSCGRKAWLENKRSLETYTICTCTNCGKQKHIPTSKMKPEYNEQYICQDCSILINKSKQKKLRESTPIPEWNGCSPVRVTDPDMKWMRCLGSSSTPQCPGYDACLDYADIMDWGEEGWVCNGVDWRTGLEMPDGAPRGERGYVLPTNELKAFLEDCGQREIVDSMGCTYSGIGERAAGFVIRASSKSTQSRYAFGVDH